MNILVTGATGFIGGAFVRLARARGHRVAALARQRLPDEDGLTWLHGTLAEPPWAGIEAFAPDHCLHAAWVAEPGVYLESPLNEDYLRWSVEFFRRLAGAGLPRAMGLGTCIEYRIDGERSRENVTPLEPLSPYARAKDALRRTVETELSRRAVWLCLGPGLLSLRPRRTLRPPLQRPRAQAPGRRDARAQNPRQHKDYIFSTTWPARSWRRWRRDSPARSTSARARA